MADREVRKNKSGGGTAPAEVLASSSEQTGTEGLEQENGTVFAVNLATLWVGAQGEEGVNWRTQLEHYQGTQASQERTFPPPRILGSPVTAYRQTVQTTDSVFTSLMWLYSWMQIWLHILAIFLSSLYIAQISCPQHTTASR